ncbi:MAG: alpha-galactosidase [Erysipelotrichaceae bacterium]|nr:alpha-galactosidase [Erysipelotrichaceae bacterium]
MSIQIQDNVFTLTTADTQYQFKADQFGILSHLWYGPVTDENMSYLQDYPDVGFSGQISEAEGDRTYSMDTKLLEYPGWGVGDYRIHAAAVREPSGAAVLDLRYEGYELIDGTVELEGLPHIRPSEEAETLKIVMKDVTKTTQVSLYYTVLPEEDVIVRWAEFKNIGAEDLTLLSAASASLDFYPEKLDLIHFHGGYCKERHFERVPIMHGVHEVSSARGQSSAQHNPAVIVAQRHATESRGRCWGMMFMYSGNFCIRTERDQLNQMRVVMGINPNTFTWLLEPGQTFTTPQALFTMSDHGFAKLSHNFHNLISRHIVEPQFRNVPRSILINNWEATYFDFNGQKILDIAGKASKLGIEMMVLDDGWFGRRNHDREGLGDWYVNEEKLGMPLQEMISKIKALGMKFGIWVEPESVSPQSELYKAHPEWAYTYPGHQPVFSRSQLCLDYGNPEVVDYMYEKLSALLRDNDISYLKWDVNRSIHDWYSPTLPPERQSELPHRYVLGLYDLLGRLRREFPEVLFEGCGGGGARFDAGMLYYTPQIWLSDDTDAHERCFIQYGSSFFYPVQTMGSHVSAVPNHQTGRMTSLEARGVSAMHGSFGYELDLNTLSEEEQETVKNQCHWYRHFQDLIYHGDYYRLTNPHSGNRSLWEYVSKDKSRVLLQGLVFYVQPNNHRQKVRLKGLDPDARYYLVADNHILRENPKSYTGKALIYGGILLPVVWGTDAPVSMMFIREDEYLKNPAVL